MKLKLAIPLLISIVALSQSCGHKKESKRPVEIEPPLKEPGPVQPSGLKFLELPILEGAKISPMTGDVLPPAQASETKGSYEDHSRLLVSEFGTDIDRASNDFFAFDLAAGRWSHLSSPASPIMFDSPAIVSTKDSLFVWGGFDSDMCGTQSNGQIYDLGRQSWKKMAIEREPLARGQADAYSYQRKIVLFGGYPQLGSGCGAADESGRTRALVDGGIYDAGFDSWTPIPAIPMTTDEKNADNLIVSSMLSGNVLYVLLSDHIELQLDNLWMLDLTKMKWSERPVKLNTPLDGSFHALVKTPGGIVVWQNAWRPLHAPSRSAFEPPMLTYFEGFDEKKSIELRYNGAETFTYPIAELSGGKYLVSMRKEYASPVTSYGILSPSDRRVRRLETVDGSQVVWTSAGNFLIGYYPNEESKVALIAYDLKSEKYYRLPETAIKYRIFDSWQYGSGKLVLWGGFNKTESQNPRDWDYPGDGIVIHLPVQ